MMNTQWNPPRNPDEAKARMALGAASEIAKIAAHGTNNRSAIKTTEWISNAMKNDNCAKLGAGIVALGATGAPVIAAVAIGSLAVFGAKKLFDFLNE